MCLWLTFLQILETGAAEMRRQLGMIVAFAVFLSGSSSVASEVTYAKDDSGNIVVVLPKGVCTNENELLNLKTQMASLQTQVVHLQSTVDKVKECGTQGLAYNYQAKSCSFPSTIPSRSIVASPSSGADKGYKVSLMYCLWRSNRYSSCSSHHSYGGQANFDVYKATASGNALTIRFQSPYLRQPVCSIQFENQVGFSTVDTRSDHIVVYMSSSSGAKLNWSSATTWMYVICHGEMN